METSSPLAALRPAPPAFGQRGLFGSRNAHLAPPAFGAGSLTLREQFNFQRPNVEYFNVEAVQGSSPTASLAADLSQNFKLNDAWLVYPFKRVSRGLEVALTCPNSAAVPCFPLPAERCSPRPP